MVSLKERKREKLTAELQTRFAGKVATLLDPSDFDSVINRSISRLDQVMYTPRNVIFDETSFIEGTNFIDVTPLRIDAINTVYFSNNIQMNMMFPELGFLPFVSSGPGLGILEGAVSYLELQSTLNLLNRQLNVIDDYELWPTNKEGQQLLQIRNKGLIRLEYLPNLPEEADSWYLFDPEYLFLKELVWVELNIFNAEAQASASGIGVGKEALALAEYWGRQRERIETQFVGSKVITYL